MTEQTPILSVQGLCAGYRGHTVLRDISFALAPGEILCVAGESGCGRGHRRDRYTRRLISSVLELQ